MLRGADGSGVEFADTQAGAAVAGLHLDAEPDAFAQGVGLAVEKGESSMSDKASDKKELKDFISKNYPDRIIVLIKEL